MNRFKNTIFLSLFLFSFFGVFESISLIRDGVFISLPALLFIIGSTVIYGIFGAVLSSLICIFCMLLFKLLKIRQTGLLSSVALALTLASFGSLYLMLLLPYLNHWPGWLAVRTLLILAGFFICLAGVLIVLFLLRYVGVA